jgi:predicted XRE-type DNA-binding protein
MITMGEKDYAISSDNIFADLGFPDAEELLMQADLSCSIIKEISRRGLTRRQAASLLGISQTDVSHLLDAHLNCFSLESLRQMSARLGMDVAVSR